ncbi:MAG: insulinase family protein, partial [Planctomycetes bacterium]|nr:insulinase family protein [Planctomycetota bacterium]
MSAVRVLRSEQLDETVHLATVDGGVRVAVVPKPGFSTAAGYFGLRFGSTDTRFRRADGSLVEVPDGSAHFLEHKLFEGREEKVFDRFGKLGADFNGGTGFRSTSYYFVSAGRFEESLDVLLDFVQRPLITAERVEKEKGIIEQEVRMYEDHPQFRGVFLLHRALYQAHAIRIPPGGTVEAVRSTTAEHLQACFDAFYRPQNLVLSLAGDLDPERVFRLVEERVEDRAAERVERIYPQEGGAPAAAELEEEFAVSRPHLWLGWRDAAGAGTGQPLVERRVLSSLVLDLALGDSSELHQDLYQRGVVDDTFSAGFSCDFDYGYAVVSAQTEQPERLVEEVRRAVARFVDEGPAE